MIEALIVCKVYGIHIDIVVVRHEQRCRRLGAVLFPAFSPILFQFVLGMGKGAAVAARTNWHDGQITAHACLVVVRDIGGLLELTVAVMLHEFHQTDHHMLDGLQRGGQLLP